MTVRKPFQYLLAAVFAICAAASLHAEVIDKIAVVVNDEVITETEISRMLAPVYVRYKQLYQGDELIAKLEKARQGIVEQLIEDRLILTEAKKLNIEVDEQDVEAKVEEARKRVGSKERFDQELASEGMGLKDLRRYYREQLMKNSLINQKVGGKITVTPVEIDNYYRDHMGDFAQPEEIRLMNILIRPGEDPEKASAAAEEVLQKIKAGGDFAELAKAYSQGPNASEGGLMDFAKKGDLLPEVENVVFNLKEGEVSGIVRTEAGYYIFKVDRKEAAKALSLPEARREVEDAIFKEKARQKVKGWIEGLKKNAYIAFK